MGAVGFEYESIKDELKWAGIEPKYYTSLLDKVGGLYVMDEKEYEKQRVTNIRMKSDEIMNKLMITFGGTSEL